MALLETAVIASDWLKSEADAYASRDTATIAAGSGKLVSGTVLAKVGAKFVPATANGTDGSQTASAVLFAKVDATGSDAKGIVVARDAIVSHAGLTWGPTINDAAKRAAAIGQLKAVGIVVREGA